MLMREPDSQPGSETKPRLAEKVRPSLLNPLGSSANVLFQQVPKGGLRRSPTLKLKLLKIRNSSRPSKSSVSAQVIPDRSDQVFPLVGVQTLPEIDEVNMFKDDNTVVHIKKHNVQFSMREQLLVVTGVPESKQLQDMLPDILKQVGPQQYNAIQKLVAGASGEGKAAAGDDDDDDDVPALVADTNFEQVAASK